jgi:hypothetical protein
MTKQLDGVGAGVAIFSPDGTRIAVGTWEGPPPANGIISVVDRASLEEVQRWDWDGDLPPLTFHPEGDRLIITDCVCSPDETVLYLDIATGRVTNVVERVE